MSLEPVESPATSPSSGAGHGFKLRSAVTSALAHRRVQSITRQKSFGVPQTSDVVRRTRLTQAEENAISAAYSQNGPVWCIEELVYFLGKLGKTLEIARVKSILSAFKWRQGSIIDLSVILKILDEQKKCHQILCNDENTEVLAAFIGLGGSVEKTGSATLGAMKEALKGWRAEESDKLGLPTLPVETEENDTVGYSRFKELFTEAQLVTSANAAFGSIQPGSPRASDLIPVGYGTARKPSSSRTKGLTFAECKKEKAQPAAAQFASVATPHRAAESGTHRTPSPVTFPGMQGLLKPIGDGDERYDIILNIIRDHYYRVENQSTMTHLARAAIEHREQATAKVMDSSGAVWTSKPGKSKGCPPIMVEREAAHLERLYEQYRDAIEPEVERRLAEMHKRTQKIEKKTRSVELTHQKLSAPFSPISNSSNPRHRPATAQVRRSSSKSTTGVSSPLSPPGERSDRSRKAKPVWRDDEFVRDIAREAKRVNLLASSETEDSRAIKRARKWQDRKEQQQAKIDECVKTVTGDRFHSRVDPAPKRRVFHLKVTSDYCETKSLRCVAGSYAELVAAVASVVVPLPRGFFVSDVWYADETDSFMPVNDIHDLPTSVTIRALVYSPPGTFVRDKDHPRSGAIAFPRFQLPVARPPKELSTEDTNLSRSQTNMPTSPTSMPRSPTNAR